MKKIYISGPMRGHTEIIFQHLMPRLLNWTREGLETYNPAQRDRARHMAQTLNFGRNSQQKNIGFDIRDALGSRFRMDLPTTVTPLQCCRDGKIAAGQKLNGLLLLRLA